MIFHPKGLAFSQFLDHFLQEIVRADAHAQGLQRNGWIELQKSMIKKEGIDLTEGIGQLEYLGLQEVKMTFFLDPVRPGWREFFKRIAGFFTGKKGAPAMGYCQITSKEKAAASGFLVTVTVGRDSGGRFLVRSEPGAEQLEGVYVTDILG